MRQHLAHHRPGDRCNILGVIRTPCDKSAGEIDRCAVLPDLEGYQLFTVFPDCRRKTHQDFRAVRLRHFRPYRKGVPRRLDGPVDIRIRSKGNLPKHLRSARIQHIECPAGNGIHPFSVNAHFVAFHTSSP